MPIDQSVALAAADQNRAVKPDQNRGSHLRHFALNKLR
ncbi:Uncharacterised protein [Vibrio cholerae]|nr:Uncharacterised protein [Vibrio cholerae]